MVYHISIIEAILIKQNVDPAITLLDISEDFIDKETLVFIWFSKLGWSASTIIKIFNELDKCDGFENIYGDGI